MGITMRDDENCSTCVGVDCDVPENCPIRCVMSEEFGEDPTAFCCYWTDDPSGREVGDEEANDEQD